MATDEKGTKQPTRPTARHSSTTRRINIILAATLALWCLNFELPSLWGPSLRSDIRVITDEPLVEKHLRKFKNVLGGDYDTYRGHLYRVLSYSMHFLQDNRTYYPEICGALVYHDLGIWTDNTLAYLDVSARRARADLSHDGRFRGNAERLQLIDDIIMYHHKVTPYFMGPHAKVVDAVRKADWIDASKGVVSMGMPRKHIRTVSSAIVNDHLNLVAFFKDLGPRVHGSKYLKILREGLSILRL